MPLCTQERTRLHLFVSACRHHTCNFPVRNHKGSIMRKLAMREHDRGGGQRPAVEASGKVSCVGAAGAGRYRRIWYCTSGGSGQRPLGCPLSSARTVPHFFVTPGAWGPTASGAIQLTAMRPCLLLFAALLMAEYAVPHAPMAAAAADGGGLTADAASTTSERRQLAAPAVTAGVPLPPDWRSEVTNDTQAWVLKQAASPEGVVIFTTFKLVGHKEEGACPPRHPLRARHGTGRLPAVGVACGALIAARCAPNGNWNILPHFTHPFCRRSD